MNSGEYPSPQEPQQPFNQPPQQPYPQEPYPPQQPPTQYPPNYPPGYQPPYPPPYAPPPPSAPPAKKKRGPLFWVALVLLALTLVACGSSQANTGTAVTPTATATTQPVATDTPTPKPTHFTVGQTVNVGNIWQIVITKVRTEQGGQYDPTPTPGQTYLVISIAAKNISSTEQQFYGSAEFTLRDPSGQSFLASYVSDARQSPSGKIEAGSPISGDIVYTVSKSVHHFTLSFETNMFEAGLTIWDITV